MILLEQSLDISYQPIQPIDLEEIARCISQVFSAGEPLSQALNISVNDFDGLVVPLCQKAIDEELSLVAKDRKTGEIMGFILSEEFSPIESDIPHGLDPKFEAVFSLLCELDRKYRNSHPVQAGKVLHILMLGVRQQYTQRQIATTLVRENLKLAKARHYERAIAEATAAGSQHLFRKLGFTEKFAIPYSSYPFNGQRIFRSIENPPSCLLMSCSL